MGQLTVTTGPTFLAQRARVPTDLLFECVKRKAAMHELLVTLHYMSCDGGMGLNQSEASAKSRRGEDEQEKAKPSNDSSESLDRHRADERYRRLFHRSGGRMP